MRLTSRSANIVTKCWWRPLVLQRAFDSIPEARKVRDVRSNTKALGWSQPQPRDSSPPISSLSPRRRNPTQPNLTFKRPKQNKFNCPLECTHSFTREPSRHHLSFLFIQIGSPQCQQPALAIMADDNPDRLLSEPPDFSNQHREGNGSMSLGAAPNFNGGDVSPINGDSITTSAPPPVHDPNAKAVHDVINSEIGVSTLLNRLKQSIASAKVSSVQHSERRIELIRLLGVRYVSQETVDLRGGTLERAQETLQNYSREYQETRTPAWLILTILRRSYQHSRADVGQRGAICNFIASNA